MISADEALRRVLAETPVLGSEPVPTPRAAGRVLAADVAAREDFPAFDASAMDGYALGTGDAAAGPSRWAVAGVVRAGDGPGVLPRGRAVKIMTGAPVPEGADAVVMRELADESVAGEIGLGARPAPGDNIRRRGEDVRTGDVVLRRGHRLRAHDLGFLASQGIAEVPVVRKPSVAILPTGDELSPWDAPSVPLGRVRASNGVALAGLLEGWGFGVTILPAVSDDARLLEEALGAAWAGYEAVLVTGGVSAGDFDFTSRAVEALGGRVVFWKVAIKPGKPLLFAVRDGRIVFGLPGNPVAALVCAEEFVRPALETMQGHRPAHPSYHLKGRLVEKYSKEAGRRQYLFCRAREESGGFRVQVIRPQGSGMPALPCRANALAVAPEGVRDLPAGTEVDFRWIK